MAQTPGASQFTVYSEGDDKITTMSPRRNVPPPSAYTVYAEELPPAERERLRKIEAPRAASNTDLPRFECKNYAKCKFAFVTEASKVDHEVLCAEMLLKGQEQYKKAGEDKPITREEIRGLVAETVAEVVKALRGGTKEKKKRGRPRGSSKAHRSKAEEDRPEPVGEVEPDPEAVADPSPESDQP